MAELSKHTIINNHFINLIDDKQSSYGLIYNLRLMELKILKTYIKTNLANGFIYSSKLLASILILFIHRKDGNL